MSRAEAPIGVALLLFLAGGGPGTVYGSLDTKLSE